MKARYSIILPPLIMFTLLLSTPVTGGQLDQQASHEIEKLLDFIGKSDCSFNRNGSWYETREALEHISKKYHYILKKGMVNSAEDFIRLAASKSSLSGKPYMVKCGNEPPNPSADWLGAELARIRTP